MFRPKETIFRENTNKRNIFYIQNYIKLLKKLYNTTYKQNNVRQVVTFYHL
jgi:hypothetical protein